MPERSKSDAPRIAVVGLGYVGLPLAVALARYFSVTGYDIVEARIAELAGGHDRTGEIDSATLGESTLAVTADAGDMAGADIFIITVPTPIDADKRPDLGAVRAAASTVGGVIAPGAIVVLESTVSPGVTEEVCGPAIAAASGLVAGHDFHLGYSPERINPGDREHTIETITKVVAGQTPAIADRLAAVYGAVTTGGIHIAPNIRTAEAAKVIENAQRDLNIAFVNEIAMIFNRAGISVHDVLAAAGTKWNFLPFQPGLVGGHCIGVDPYYLAEFARRVGHHPEVILAGRRVNDAMGANLAGLVEAAMAGDDGNLARDGAVPGRVLVLGLTFKENVPDLRNSKVVDLVTALRGRGHTVEIHDPLADPDEAMAHYGLTLLPTLDSLSGYGCVVGAVAHDTYREMGADALARLLAPGGLLADLKGLWAGLAPPPGIRLWEL
jgi:UDP-N-acetyl-D-galactosamine dehydrogenase